MRRGVVLPELTDLLELPAANRFSRLLEFGVRGESVCRRPTANRGTIELEVETATDLRGRETVAGRRVIREQLAQEIGDNPRPVLALAAARRAGFPGVLAAPGAGTQIIAVERVEATMANAEFGAGIAYRDVAFTEPRENIADKGAA